MTPSILYRLMTPDLREDGSGGLATNGYVGLELDLEVLLNTRRPYPAWGARVASSVAGFGMPDITTEDFSSQEARERVKQQMEKCLRQHEPRLHDVNIWFDPDASLAQGVRFTICATLRGSDETLELGARLTPVDRMVEIERGK